MSFVLCEHPANNNKAIPIINTYFLIIILSYSLSTCTFFCPCSLLNNIINAYTIQVSLYYIGRCTMDYYKIGQRIRKFRKANNLSQEQLAEKIGISVTHLSHIETGNTKLSLQVLVNIADCLSVQTDELLYDTNIKNSYLKEEILDIISNCSTQDFYILRDIIKAAKYSLDKYKNQNSNS